MSQHYQFEFKKKIVRLHLEEGRTLRSLAEESELQKENDFLKKAAAFFAKEID